MNFLFKGESIDYNLFGKGNHTILFLHGWGGDKNSFLSTINLLKNRYRILTITMPTTAPTSNVWTLNDYSTLISAILKTHHINSIIIVCHSFGFRVVTLLKEVIKIEKLVVTGGAGPKRSNVFIRIKTQNNKILLKHRNSSFLFSKIASSDYVNLSPTNKETFKNIVNFNTKKLLKFSCPILLFWGKFDTDTKLWIAKAIKKQNNVNLISTKSDHFAYLKLNTKFNHEVVKFLEGKL